MHLRLINFAYFFQMSGSSGSIPDDDWICAVCLQRPLNSLKLEYDNLPGDKVFLEDENGDIWLFCWNCKQTFHLKCVENIPDGTIVEDQGPYYYCENCS